MSVLGFQFHGAFIEASIRKGGTVIPLGLPDLPFLDELEVEFGLGFNAQIKLTLTPPYREALRFLEDSRDLLAWGESALSVRFGYGKSGRMTPEFTGVMMKPDVDYGQTTTITLNAIGMPHTLTNVQSGRVWKNVARRQIARDILSKYGLVMVETPDAERNPLWTDPITLSQYYRSDWFLLQSLLGVCGLMGIPSGMRVFEVKSIDKNVFGGSASRVFRLNGMPELERRVYPMIAFRSPTAAAYLPGGAREVLLRGIDPDLKKKVERSITGTSDPQARTATGHPAHDRTVTVAAPDRSSVATVKGFDKKLGETGLKLPGAPVDAKDKVVLEARAAAARLMSAGSEHGVGGGVQGIFELGVGVEDLLPGEISRMENVGRRFDGPYAVWKVRHRIDRVAFITSGESISNYYPKDFASSSTFGDFVVPRGDVAVASVGGADGESNMGEPARLRVAARAEA